MAFAKGTSITIDGQPKKLRLQCWGMSVIMNMGEEKWWQSATTPRCEPNKFARSAPARKNAIFGRWRRVLREQKKGGSWYV
ncbi:MAG: hypothetical protein AAAC48_10940 [Phyllobacterium sp.]|jgi:hypothetical protein|uniref:hypothetical protein n=1 Tax=Phyllobacterium sp. TaxID=1871046 RepID=UPI0030F0AE05